MSGFDERPDVGGPGKATLAGPGAPPQPGPGKSTPTAPALPRTTAGAGVVAPSASGPTGAPSSVERYSDMLAVVLAAKNLTDHAEPDDPKVHEQVLALIAPLERRLGQLNDHQGRLAKFGAGNIAGQAALDMSEAAIRSWRQLLLLGAIVRTDELVTRFRIGAEVLQFLTGEQRDAPTLREFNHVSGLVGIGAASPIVIPLLVALAAEGTPLLAFAARVSARQVALWAAAHPLAALAASEALLGFGLQIGEGGWERFWGQLQDPQARWFVVAQVLMDYMHIRSGMGGHDAPAGSPRATAPRIEPDIEGARQRLEKARVALQQVQDAVASAEPTAGAPTDAAAPSSPKPVLPAREGGPSADRTTSATAPVASAGGQPGKADPAAVGPKTGEAAILGRSFRSPNTAHMPNAVAAKVLAKQWYDIHTDCSDLAHQLHDAVGSGRILRVEPAAPGTLRLLEDDLIENDLYYHEAYTDGAYVFDIRMSKAPIPKGDWTSVITRLNPGVRIK
jgi:hypothetical protein